MIQLRGAVINFIFPVRHLVASLLPIPQWYIQEWVQVLQWWRDRRARMGCLCPGPGSQSYFPLGRNFQKMDRCHSWHHCLMLTGIGSRLLLGQGESGTLIAWLTLFIRSCNVGLMIFADLFFSRGGGANLVKIGFLWWQRGKM